MAHDTEDVIMLLRATQGAGGGAHVAGGKYENQGMHNRRLKVQSCFQLGIGHYGPEEAFRREIPFVAVPNG